MSNILTWIITDKNDLENPPAIYNGEFEELKIKLQTNINELIQDFEEKTNTTVLFGKMNFENSEPRVNVRLLIDLDKIRLSH